MAIRKTDKGWVVDHIPSGFKLPWYIDVRTRALCFAAELQSSLDFNFKNPFAKKAQALKPKITKIAEKWGIIQDPEEIEGRLKWRTLAN